MIYAATGHRPDKLGGYDSLVDARLRNLALAFLREQEDGVPAMVISGMAQGWDMAWAEAALALGIPLIAAVPFDGQESRWPEPAQKRWRGILDQANNVEVISYGEYAAWKMQVRNRWMVNRCDVLVALWNGAAGGGTANCVEYAQQQRKPIVNLWERFNGK